MNLDQYLAQFIEGYLLEDLRAMAPIRLAPGKEYGAVGYPMVMTVLSGIEVLGALTSPTKFNPENGASRFGDYWRNYMYPDRPARQRLADLVYQSIRHGLAHSFMTKPMIRVTKHADARSHLTMASNDVLCVDANVLAIDFEKAYLDRLRPAITGQFRVNMETRLREFLEAYWQEFLAKEDQLAKVPRGFEQGIQFENASTQVDSPSVAVTWVSTSGIEPPPKE